MADGNGNGDGATHARTNASLPLADCERRFLTMEIGIKRMNDALFGPDGTNGMAAKVNKIETQTGFIRYVGQSVFGVVVVIITLILSRWLGL